MIHIHADPNTMPHIASGKANLLAVLDRKRRPDYPNVPILKEIYPELDFVVWFGVLAPAGTPPAITQKFSQEIAKISRDKDVTDLLFKVATTPNPDGTPEEMTKLMSKDFETYGALIRKLDIKAE